MIITQLNEINLKNSSFKKRYVKINVYKDLTLKK